MNRTELISLIKRKRSFLCVGLDTDIHKIPQHLLEEEDPVFSFNKAIIDATVSYAVAYKPNIAFYEKEGVKGWESLQKTMQYIQQTYPGEVFAIADAKRGDIGNTSKQYAQTFFSGKYFDFDAITVAPYMGKDSVSPFLEYPDKWVIVLALTSNKGAFDFQFIETPDGKPLFEHVLAKAKQWGDEKNMMFVVGATKAKLLQKVRSIIPEHFLLVPGVGAQGGSLAEVAEYGMTPDCGLLVNASRSVIYASQKNDFFVKAGEEAEKLQQEMSKLLHKNGIA